MLVGFLFSYLLYGRKSFIFFAEEKKSLRYILATLRFLAVSLIAFLLLSPLIKTTQTEEQKPTIVLLQDNSASLKNVFKQSNLKQYQEKLNALTTQLGKKYNVITHQFGGNLSTNKTLDFTQQSTDIDNAIKQTFLKYDHLNIGAIILASDGIYNVGNNPVYNPFATKTPIYTIALGDTTIKKDALIRNLLYPNIVYLTDNFNLQVDVDAHLLNGKNTILEVIDSNGKIVFNKSISIHQDDFSTSAQIVLQADKPGILKYHVRLKMIDGETISENNIQTAYIEVIDGRQKILLLYGSPHPDVKAFKYAIESNKNYQIEVESADNFNKKLDKYDMIILHLSSSLDANLIQEISQSKLPILYILSAQANINTFNNLQNLLKISGSSLNGNDVFPIPQSNFSKFVLDEQSTNILKQLPPILTPYGKYSVNPNADILFRQQLGKVPTNNPLILFADENNKKTGIFAGEGWWRWRLNEFMQFKNTDATDILINKSIQFLTVKTDKRKFKISTSKQIYGTNEPIVLEAQLYNESFVLINEPEVNLELKNGKNAYRFVFDKTLNAYILNTGILPAGDYTANAQTNYKGQQFKASTKFSVQPINIEVQNLQANWSILRTLAQQSCGKTYTVQNLESIADAIQKDENIQSILFENTKTQPLIDWKILFGIILLLLSAEWIIRKYNGIA